MQASLRGQRDNHHEKELLRDSSDNSAKTIKPQSALLGCSIDAQQLRLENEGGTACKRQEARTQPVAQAKGCAGGHHPHGQPTSVKQTAEIEEMVPHTAKQQVYFPTWDLRRGTTLAIAHIRRYFEPPLLPNAAPALRIIMQSTLWPC